MTNQDFRSARDRLRAHLPVRLPQALPVDGAVPAAVLVLIYPREGVEHVLLTERSSTVEHHKGQISFPGGAVDATDVDAVATALRETLEEVGLAADGIEILGRLDDHRTGTNFHITPVVGLLEEPPLGFAPSPHEVAAVWEVPLAALLDPANFMEEPRERDGVVFTSPAYLIEGRRIWGVTAQILTRLLDLLREEGAES